MIAAVISKNVVVFSVLTLVASGMAHACGGPSCDCNTLVQTINAITASEAQNGDAESALYTHLQMLGDQDFMREAMEGSAANVLLAQLALQKSQRSDLKQFAQIMIQDQVQLSQQVLERVGRPIGVQEERDLAKKDKQLVARLMTLPGGQFDAEFIQTLLKGKKQQLKRFRDETQLAVDPRVQLAAAYDKNLTSQHVELLERIAQGQSVVAENQPATIAGKR